MYEQGGNKSDNKVNGEQRIILKIFETHVERASISNVNPVKIWTGRRMMVSNKRLNNFFLFLGSELESLQCRIKETTRDNQYIKKYANDSNP